MAAAREWPTSHLNSHPPPGGVSRWVCVSLHQKEISSCAERQAWGSVWQSLDTQRDNSCVSSSHAEPGSGCQLLHYLLWQPLPQFACCPQGMLCQLLVWLLFWQAIAPGCQHGLSIKKGQREILDPTTAGLDVVWGDSGSFLSLLFPFSWTVMGFYQCYSFLVFTGLWEEVHAVVWGWAGAGHSVQGKLSRDAKPPGKSCDLWF